MLEVHLSSHSPVFIGLTFILLVALVLAKHRLASKAAPSGPPPLPPLVDAPSSDPYNVRDTFLHRRSRYGNVFRAIEPHGATVTYIGDALTIKDIIDRPDAFDISSLHTAAAPMWNISNPAGVWFAHTGGQATLQHSSHLLSGARLASLQQRFVCALSKQFDALEPGHKGDLFALASETFFQATVEALFTPTFPPGQYTEFLRWDAELDQFCMACPSPRAVQSRDRFYNLVLQQIDQHLSECSLQVREQLHNVEREHGQTHADAVGVVLRTAWLGSTQSPLSGAWLLCILSRQPTKVARIRAELQQLKQKLAVHDVEEIVANPDLLKAENLPLLDHLVQELLRVYSAQSVPRLCLKDTVVRALDGPGRVRLFQLKQGDILRLLFWNVHDATLNLQWWPESQGKGEKFRGTLQTFDESRFDRVPKPAMVKLDSNEAVRTWTPFGYGSRVCPGRYWAVAEVKAFILLFLHRFELEGAVAEPPRPDPKRWVGVMHPLDAMPATLKARS